MEKKTVKVAIILILVALVIVSAFLIIEKTTSFELRLGKELDYEEILLLIDEYALVRVDEDTAVFVCNPGFDKHGGSWPKDFSVYLEFDLNSHRVVQEWCISRHSGVFRNGFAENARQEFYAYSDITDVRRGLPTGNIYMGISALEPSYENIGANTDRLQYVELNGLYYFMFLEDFYA